MTQPQLFGTSRSRALRALWGIEEVGIDFEHVPTTFGPDSKTPEYLAVNPNGRIPALIDGELRLFESMAINLYLCKTYGGALYPAAAHDEARAWQWSVWAMSEIEPLQMQVVSQRFFTPEDQRNPAVIDKAVNGLQRPLQVIDAALAGKEWLIGTQFSVADLNVACVMQTMKRAGIETSAYANVDRWLAACSARPALARARARP